MRNVLGATRANTVFYEVIFVHELRGSVKIHLYMSCTVNSRASACVQRRLKGNSVKVYGGWLTRANTVNVP